MTLSALLCASNLPWKEEVADHGQLLKLGSADYACLATCPPIYFACFFIDGTRSISFYRNKYMHPLSKTQLFP